MSKSTAENAFQIPFPTLRKQGSLNKWNMIICIHGKYVCVCVCVFIHYVYICIYTHKYKYIHVKLEYSPSLN